MPIKDTKPLNTYELQAIDALSAWVATGHNTAPETVRSAIATHFGAPDVKGLPRKDYDEVIRFLLGLRLDEPCE